MHNAAQGIASVACSSSIGANKVIRCLFKKKKKNFFLFLIRLLAMGFELKLEFENVGVL